MPSAVDPCSELSKVITDLAMMIGEQPGMDTLDKVTAELQRHIPEITRDEVVNSIVEATATHREALDDARQQVSALKREARSEAALRKRIIELERHLEAATLPDAKPRSDTATNAVKELREIRDGLNKALHQSEPARRKRILESIDRLTEKLDAVDNVPPVNREAMPLSKELERLAYERDRLRRQVREKVNSLKPRTFWSRAAEPVNLARAMMTSLDFSAVLRQGGFVTLGHPRRAARALRPMFQAARSKEADYRINQAILNRPNAPLYDRAGLHITDDNGPLSHMEEAFMSRIADRVPFVAGSARGYRTFLNVLRADSFDAMAETLSMTGDPTMEEAQAIANYVNVATGRGKLGRFGEPAATPLATVFFAPRLVASRFQVIAGQPFYGGNARTRKIIAQEYGRFLAGIGVVYLLGALAGGEIEKDPRSSDFGKIKFGDTRVDPLAGLSQVTVLLARELSGEKLTMEGDLRPLSGEDVPYGGDTRVSIIGRFLRQKLAPAFGAAANMMDRKNVVGEPVTIPGETARLVTPLAYRDIYEAMQEHGVAGGTALGILSMFGMGVQTYDEDESDLSRR